MPPWITFGRHESVSLQASPTRYLGAFESLYCILSSDYFGDITLRIIMAQSSDNRAWDTQQKDAKQALAEDTWDDCMSCRVMGAFTGLGRRLYLFEYC